MAIPCLHFTVESTISNIIGLYSILGFIFDWLVKKFFSLHKRRKSEQLIISGARGWGRNTPVRKSRQSRIEEFPHS